MIDRFNRHSVDENNKKVELHSTASHGAFYFYAVLKDAVWLLKQNNKIDVVEIYFHPVVVLSPAALLSPNTLKIIAGSVKKKWAFIKSNLSYLLKNPADVFAPKNKDLKSDSLYKNIFEFGNSCSIKTTNGDLFLFPAKKKLIKSLRVMLANDWVAIKLWLGLYVAGKLDARRLLQLKYEGVLIGDLIASSSLRAYPKAGGSLHKSRGFLSLIARSVALVDYCKNNLSIIDYNDAYVTIPEPTYLHAIYRRSLHSFGANILETHHYKGYNKIIESNKVLTNPAIVQNPDLKNRNVNREKSIVYLNIRIEKPIESLWYMYNGVNRSDELLLDLNGFEVRIQGGQLYAVVFLHSFDDGQYYFGLDGFDDLYEWTTETIDQLLENKNFNTIFVKPHPNSNYSRCPGDLVAFQRLTKRYKQRERIVWLRKDISPKAFVNSGKFFGITHHGSVAEELVFLEVPVIAGTCAPWGSAYKFVHTWRSPNEYREMLKSLSLDTWNRPSDYMRNDLYRFVQEYRINTLPVEEKHSWMIFAKLIDHKKPAVTPENFNFYVKMLEELSSDSKIFHQFMEI
jgi:hypothetical protein